MRWIVALTLGSAILALALARMAARPIPEPADERATEFWAHAFDGR